MHVTLSLKNRHHIRSTPVLQQTSFWSEVKERQGVHSLAVSLSVPAEELGITGEASGRRISEDILILFQEIGDNFCIGYVPYGPKIQPVDDVFGIFLEELSESLRPFLPENCIMLRFDLKWRSLWDEDETNYDENGIWEGPPPKRNQELRMNFSTENWNLRKAGTDVLPSDTVFLDLSQGEEQLLAAMKPKTRYNMRLSRRRGVKVRSADIGELDTWYRLYRETCRRNGINLHSCDYFKAVAEADKAHIGTTGEVDLLIAEAEGAPLAAMFLAYSSNRATYLFGASADRKGRHMPAYALQWEAIRRARLKGCTEYDMFGVSPTANPSHPLYGLYRFKTGFGGSLFHRMGCWDYPLDRDIYSHYAAAEMNGGGYHVH